MKIVINDTDYGLQWGMGALEIYCDAMGCDIDGLDKVFLVNKEQNKAIVSLILAAVQNYSELKDEPLTLSVRQLQAWLDEDAKNLPEVLDDFKNSKYLGRTISEYLLGEEPGEVSIKKKSRSVKS
ncbi:MAG TPA: hypothetical protein VHA52_04640 [Candidatus Babeliaceae bacterium]|nr:hypothetical protein [Candidatus Babeliaceae bacterium]